MVTPNGEPWEVVEDTGVDIAVYNIDGELQFSIELQYGNITQEKLQRLILCFNACTGIPDGALESAIASHNSIWSVGYNVGVGEKQHKELHIKQCVFRDCENIDLVLGIDSIGKVCNTHSILFTREDKIHSSQCPNCSIIVYSDSVAGLTLAVNTHVCE